MGADVSESEANRLHIRRGAWPLKAIELDCNHIPDAAMTLAVMALYADGTTTLRNIASWRVKETDRIAAMASRMRKLGATVESKARTSSKSRRLPRSGPRAASTPMTTTVLPCASRWRPSTRPACRCALKTPSAWPRPSRTTLKRCSRSVGPRQTAENSGHLRRRPHRLGQGHAWLRKSPSAWATTFWTPARCTASPRLAAQPRRHRPGLANEPALARLRPSLPIRFEDQPHLPGRARCERPAIRTEVQPGA